MISTKEDNEIKTYLLNKSLEKYKHNHKVYQYVINISSAVDAGDVLYRWVPAAHVKCIRINIDERQEKRILREKKLKRIFYIE